MIEKFQYKKVPELEEMGVFRLIDGSIFPTLSYKQLLSFKKIIFANCLH